MMYMYIYIYCGHYNNTYRLNEKRSFDWLSVLYRQVLLDLFTRETAKLQGTGRKTIITITRTNNRKLGCKMLLSSPFPSMQWNRNSTGIFHLMTSIFNLSSSLVFAFLLTCDIPVIPNWRQKE